MRAILPAAALLLSAASCDALSYPGSFDVRVDVRRSSYERHPRTGAAQVEFSVTNRRDDTIYILECFDTPFAVLQKDGPYGWEDVSDLACSADQVEGPVPLFPGESDGGLFPVFAPGRYRLRVPYTAHEDYRIGGHSRAFEVY